MGKKKRREDSAGGDAPQRRIYCYYCERNFDDEKVLILHQKARHFKCPTCYKKLSTISGMSIHIQQVHKESLKSIPNAKPGKESVDVEVYGMEGIPDATEGESKKPRLEGPGGTLIGRYPGRGVPPPVFSGGRGPLPMQFPVGMTPPGAGMSMRPPPPRAFIPGGVLPPSHAPGFPVYGGGIPPQWARGLVPPGSMVPPSQAALGYANQGRLGPGLGPGAAPLAVTIGSTNIFDGAAQKAVKHDLGLVYADENVSMEEKRARRPKYAYKLLGASACAGGSRVT
uniref:C2H2-type domain-containing protein n=1 Tax=Peronospora matthiolae TaxID=2874970 RepID=A0AAV1T6C5_9STRA